MKKRTLKIKLLVMLFFTSLIFYACEQEEVEPMSPKTVKERFFTPEVKFSKYEKVLLEGAKKWVPDTAVVKWTEVYGNPNYKEAEFLVVENMQLLLVPMLKEANRYEGLLTIFQDENRVRVDLFTNKDILSDIDHPLFVRYAKMQKEIGNPNFQKYSFEILDVVTKSFVAVQSYNCIRVYFDFECNGEELSVSKWNCKEGTITVWVDGDDEYGEDDREYGGGGGSAGGSAGGSGGGSGGSYGGGSGGSSTGNTGRKPDPVPEIDDEEIEGTKVGCVKEKLEKGGDASLLSKLLKGFKLSNSNLDVIFHVENLGSSVNGITRHNPNTGEISVIINSQMMNRSSLQLARTVLHECFHAHMFGKLHQGKLHNSLPEPNFEKDFKEYEKKFGEDNAQHDYMADKYRKHMKEGLREYFRNESYYQNAISNFDGNMYWKGEDFMLECLTWTGLKKTNAWEGFIKDATNKKKYDEQYQFIINQLPKERCE